MDRTTSSNAGGEGSSVSPQNPPTPPAPSGATETEGSRGPGPSSDQQQLHQQPAAATHTPAPPPASRIVVEGTRTEREVSLEKELLDERNSHASTQGEKKARENRISELEDELHRLKQLDKRGSKKGWGELLDVSGFFED